MNYGSNSNNSKTPRGNDAKRDSDSRKRGNPYGSAPTMRGNPYRSEVPGGENKKKPVPTKKDRGI